LCNEISLRDSTGGRLQSVVINFVFGNVYEPVFWGVFSYKDKIINIKLLFKETRNAIYIV